MLHFKAKTHHIRFQIQGVLLLKEEERKREKGRKEKRGMGSATGYNYNYIVFCEGTRGQNLKAQANTLVNVAVSVKPVWCENCDSFSFRSWYEVNDRYCTASDFTDRNCLFRSASSLSRCCSCCRRLLMSSTAGSSRNGASSSFVVVAAAMLGSIVSTVRLLQQNHKQQNQSNYTYLPLFSFVYSNTNGQFTGPYLKYNAVLHEY